jgi:hypothetical protein
MGIDTSTAAKTAKGVNVEETWSQGFVLIADICPLNIWP